jgi:hypothetical protein
VIVAVLLMEPLGDNMAIFDDDATN